MTKTLVLQSLEMVKSTLKSVADVLKVFSVNMYGQEWKLAFPHLAMPGTTLLGLAAGLGGTLALISLDLRFGATL